MPGMNGTGPEGKGSKTGRGLGRCARVSDTETIGKPGKGRGKRMKAGRGQGKRNPSQSG